MADSIQHTRLGRIGGDSQYKPHDIQTHSKFVRILRIALPVIAAAVISVLFVWPQMDQTILAVEKTAASIETIEGTNRLLSAKYQSVDNKNQPYTIMADQAMQAMDNKDVVILDKPMADLQMNDGRWLAAQSAKGSYSQSKERLVLSNGVRIFHDDGYQLITDHMDIDFNTGRAEAKQAVSVDGPDGSIEASGMDIFDMGNHIIFRGPAKAVILMGNNADVNDGGAETQ